MSAAKDYLQRINYYNAQIETKMQEREQLRDMLLRVTPVLKDDVGTSNNTQDKFGATMAKIVDLEAEINQAIDSYVDAKREVNNTIDRLENEKYVKVLRKRYMLGEPWEQIAIEMGCTYRNVCYIHGEALLEVDKILKVTKM